MSISSSTKHKIVLAVDNGPMRFESIKQIKERSMSTDTADTKPGSFDKPIVIDEAQERFVEKINAQREKNVEKFHILLDQYNVARKALADEKGTAITLFDLQGFQVYAVNEKLARKKLGGLLKRAGLVLVSKHKTEPV